MSARRGSMFRSSLRSTSAIACARRRPADPAPDPRDRAHPEAAHPHVVALHELGCRGQLGPQVVRGHEGQPRVGGVGEVDRHEGGEHGHRAHQDGLATKARAELLMGREGSRGARSGLGGRGFAAHRGGLCFEQPARPARTHLRPVMSRCARAASALAPRRSPRREAGVEARAADRAPGRDGSGALMPGWRGPSQELQSRKSCSSSALAGGALR